MPEPVQAYAAILLMGAVVLATRLAGVALGSLIGDRPAVARVIGVLPGAAIMALLAPAAARAEPVELAALAATALVMWLTRQVLVASLAGLGILVASAHLLA